MPEMLELALRLRDAMVLILLAAGARSDLTAQAGDFMVIVWMVVLSVELDFVPAQSAAAPDRGAA